MKSQFKNFVNSLKNIFENNTLLFLRIILIIVASVASFAIIPCIFIANLICIGIGFLITASYSEIEKLLESQSTAVKIALIIVLSTFIVLRYLFGALLYLYYTITSSIWQAFSYVISCFGCTTRHKFYCPYKDDLVYYNSKNIEDNEIIIE